MSSTTVLVPARPITRAAAAGRKAKRPEPTAADRLGFALEEALNAAAALLDDHGDGCDCFVCHSTHAALFNLETHLAVVECNTHPDDMPLFWDHRTQRIKRVYGT